ncbi:Metallo-dependent phosphatase-like protein [Clohesyomyces aquaticus]|uniref:Metallo-dependent phosphatase-like protein n=1 Tax=Clohesyomyces aquaticus TaxID=1231657 RepID=A0A1Y1YTQ7_9PLEO|nr:Metallo-dependent phosphatase-like protein [Clohesyomyces aquaticus]
MPIVFPQPALRFVCISDTHNDNPTARIPAGDIFIHAGDMTDTGTLSELQNAFDWISALPHAVKIVVAGNHDLGLDPGHKDFDPKAVDLFTSAAAKATGIYYLYQEVRIVAQYITDDATLAAVRVYGNPKQPDFLNMPYAFTYPPYPSPESVAAWAQAPNRQDGINIWVMHSPPINRLDAINVPGGLTGCIAQYKRIAAARPLLCVFGHYHFSWGAERVRWKNDHDHEVSTTDILTLSEERKREQSLKLPETRFHLSFASITDNSLPSLEVGKETLFVNASWMTMKKRKVEERNFPLDISLRLP